MPSYEEIRKIFDKVDEELKERDQKRLEERREEIRKMGLTPLDGSKADRKKHFDHPNTTENGTATFFWIVSLVIGALFKGAWVIWIISTIIWINFITRHDK